MDLQKIDEGAFGSIYPYSNNRAIKTITDESNFKMMLREIKMAEYASIRGNQHIIRTLGCIVHGDNNKGILMEMGGVDSFKYIQDVLKIVPGIGLDGTVISYFITDLVKGLDFLHSHEIYHCDMKLENVLHTSKGLKICDFGLAHHDKWVYRYQGREMKYGSLIPIGGIIGYFGSQAYLPTYEIATMRSPKLRDEWALGMIIFTLSYGTFIYDTYKLLTDKIERILQTANTNDMYYSHIVGCHPRKDVEYYLKLLIRETPMDIHTFARRWGD